MIETLFGFCVAMTIVFVMFKFFGWLCSPEEVRRSGDDGVVVPFRRNGYASDEERA